MDWPPLPLLVALQQQAEARAAARHESTASTLHTNHHKAMMMTDFPKFLTGKDGFTNSGRVVRFN